VRVILLTAKHDYTIELFDNNLTFTNIIIAHICPKSKCGHVKWFIRVPVRMTVLSFSFILLKHALDLSSLQFCFFRSGLAKHFASVCQISLKTKHLPHVWKMIILPNAGCLSYWKIWTLLDCHLDQVECHFLHSEVRIALRALIAVENTGRSNVIILRCLVVNDRGLASTHWCDKCCVVSSWLNESLGHRSKHN